MNKETSEDILNNLMKQRVDHLVEKAEVFKDTKHIALKFDAWPENVSPESLATHVDFLNQTGLAVEAAVTNIGYDQFEETKIENWDGRLELIPGVVINSSTQMKEVVEDVTTFGNSQTFIDHPHSPELVNWYSNFADTNVERVKKLFD